MGNLLALEWDDFEARIAIAESRRGSIVLEQAFSVALPAAFGESGAHATPSGQISMSGAHDLGAIGRYIRDALAARGVRRVKTLVAVGRANIELKNLTIPPAPPEEMPELVRFQAEKEFNTLADDWPLDFIPVPGEAEESVTVLAAAISPELVSEIQITCEAANLTPERLVLRPCAAASLLSRTKPGVPGKLRLLVDLVAEEADLTVLSGDSVIFMRTTRLPTESFRSDPLRTMLPEIRRTIAAVHARFQGQTVAEVYLCGEGTSQEALARDIGRELDLRAEIFNPLTCCTQGAELKRSMPDHPSRFASLVGMLLDDAAGDANTIDFLNPRKKPEPVSRKKQYIIGGSIAAAVFLVLAGWIGWGLHSYDTEIAEKTLKEKSLTEEAKGLADVTVRATAINRWLGGGAKELSWLDELANLAKKLPPAQEIMLSNLQVPVQQSSGLSKGPAKNEMHFDALAKDPEILKKTYDALDDKFHDIQPPKTEDLKAGTYPWKASVKMEVRPETDLTVTDSKGKAADKKGAAKSGSDKSGSDKSGSDKSADKSNEKASEKAGDKSAEKSTDKASEKSTNKAAEKSAGDKSGTDKSTAEKSAPEKAAADSKAPEKKSSDEKAAEKPAEKSADKSAAEKSSAEKGSAEKPPTDKPSTDAAPAATPAEKPAAEKPETPKAAPAPSKSEPSASNTEAKS